MQDRIKNIRESLELKQTEFAKKLDVPNSTIHKYENGIVEPSSKFLSKIATIFNINMNWLLTGEGEMFLNKSDEPNCNCNSLHIPLKEAFASAGRGYNNSKEGITKQIPFTKAFLNEIGASAPDCDIIRIYGNSMCPTFNDGDYVMVDKSKKDRLEGIHVVVLDDDVYIKILQRLPGKNLLLKSLNKDYAPITVDLSYENFQVIGKVIWRSQKIT